MSTTNFKPAERTKSLVRTFESRTPNESQRPARPPVALVDQNDPAATTRDVEPPKPGVARNLARLYEDMTAVAKAPPPPRSARTSKSDITDSVSLFTTSADNIDKLCVGDKSTESTTNMASSSARSSIDSIQTQPSAIDVESQIEAHQQSTTTTSVHTSVDSPSFMAAPAEQTTKPTAQTQTTHASAASSETPITATTQPASNQPRTIYIDRQPAPVRRQITQQSTAQSLTSSKHKVDAGSVKPLPVTSEPQPVSSTIQPASSKIPPASSTIQPVTSTPQPVTSTPQSMTSTPQPIISTPQPATPISLPVSSKPQRDVLIVFAHWERRSFNGALLDAAVAALRADGCNVTVSDLYTMGFNPLPSMNDIRDGPRDVVNSFQYGAEMGQAYDRHTLAADIMAEQKKLDSAELIIFQFPLNWASVPAMLKGWFDRVLSYKYAYGYGEWFDRGKLKGKKALLSFTTGSPETAYCSTGFMGDLNIILWPIQNNVLRFCGLDVLSPQVCFAPGMVSADTRLAMLTSWRQRLKQVWTETPLSFIHIDQFDPATCALHHDAVEALRTRAAAVGHDARFTVGQHATGGAPVVGAMYRQSVAQENKVVNGTM